MLLITKEQLEGIKILDDSINVKISEIGSLRDIATSINAVLKDEVVQASKEHDKMGSLVAKIVDLENEVNADIDKLVDLRTSLLEEIKNVLGQGTVEFNVIYLKYFVYKRQCEISYLINYTRQAVGEIEKRALKKLELPDAF